MSVRGAEPSRILILNPFGIGDVLFTTPVIRALRCAFPQSRIHYLCNRRTEPILRNNPHLNGVIVYERDEMVQAWRRSFGKGFKVLTGLLEAIRRQQFDLVLDLSLSDRYAFGLRVLGVPRVMGFDYRHRGRFLTDRLPIDGFHGAHVVEYQRRILWFLGVRMLEDELEMALPEDDIRWAEAWLRRQPMSRNGPLIGIIPAGGVSWGIGASFRRWGVEGFAAVGDALAERYAARVILFGESADRNTCEAVAKLMRAPSVDATGQTSLGQFIALLKQLDLVICNDGGPLHLAVSQGVKTVSVFGPVDPQVYGPHPATDGRHRTVYRADLLCRPCYHRFRLPPCPYERACLTGVEPADVLSACEALLGERSVRHG